MSGSGKFDISKASEQEIRTELARQQNANKLLEATNKVLQRTLACETDRQLAATCLEVAKTLTQSAFGFIGEVNPNGLFDTLAIDDAGMQDCLMPAFELAKLLKNMPIRGIDRNTIREGSSRIVNDPQSHPDWVGTPDGHIPIQCFLGVPLQHHGRMLGMIGLANRPNGFTLVEQDAVEALSVSFVDAMHRKRDETKLMEQARALLEASTPVMQVWEGIVVAPLIGTLDSERTQQFMERFLSAIVHTRSEVALVDITGVPSVDTTTAQHLLEATAAARLLGARLVLTGVRPSIAQTLVQLGMDLSKMVTRSSLSAGLREALQMLGLNISAITQNAIEVD